MLQSENLAHTRLFTGNKHMFFLQMDEIRGARSALALSGTLNLKRKNTPEIEDGFGCSLLVNKHVLPVDHGERVQDGAESLDGCRRENTHTHTQVRAALTSCHEK